MFNTFKITVPIFEETEERVEFSASAGSNTLFFQCEKLNGKWHFSVLFNNGDKRIGVFNSYVSYFFDDKKYAMFTQNMTRLSGASFYVGINDE